jgi:hypothetical protein
MDLAARQQFLTDLADHKVALRDVGGLSAADITAIAAVGAAALQAGRHAQAVTVFAGLSALAPDEPLHLLHLAAAQQAGGDVAAAEEAVSRFLDDSAPHAAARDDGDVARAYLLRAELRGRNAPEGALADLQAAQALAARSKAAAAAVGPLFGGRK